MNTFTTINGVTISYGAISLDALRLSWQGIEQKLRLEGLQLDPPTYTVTTATGATLLEPHDITTEKTPEEQAAWDAYVQARAKLQKEKDRLLMVYILDDGLKHLQPPEDTSWLKKYEERYVAIPDNPLDLRRFWLTVELFPTKQELTEITVRIMTLSELGKVDPDVLQARLESFQNRMDRRRSGQTISGDTQPTGNMEAQLPVQ